MHLAVIGVFYFLVGVLMLTSASTVLDAWGEGARTFAGSRPAHWLALAAGATLLWFALRDWIPSAASKSPTRGPSTPERASTPAGHDGGVHPVVPDGTSSASSRAAAPGTGTSPTRGSGPDRAAAAEQRWGARISRALTTPWGLVALAVTAGLLELPTMLPYVAAIGVLTVEGPAGPAAIGWLGLYCLVMLLLGARVLLDRRIEAPMQRLGAWLGKASTEAVLWIMGAGGFLLVRYALQGL